MPWKWNFALTNQFINYKVLCFNDDDDNHIDNNEDDHDDDTDDYDDGDDDHGCIVIIINIIRMKINKIVSE